jgi:hypothetical protein
MPNSAAWCTSFKRELLAGIHALGTTVVRAATTKDTVKAALYRDTANLGAGTTAYTASGEVATVGGYVAGGIVVTNANEPAVGGTSAYWTPSASLVFSSLSTGGPVDAVLLYNASQANRAMGVFTFAPTTVVAGTLTLTMPVNDAANALLQQN